MAAVSTPGHVGRARFRLRADGLHDFQRTAAPRKNRRSLEAAAEQSRPLRPQCQALKDSSPSADRADGDAARAAHSRGRRLDVRAEVVRFSLPSLFATERTSSCSPNPAKTLTRYFPEIVSALLESGGAAFRCRRGADDRRWRKPLISTRFSCAIHPPRAAFAGSRRRPRGLRPVRLTRSRSKRTFRAQTNANAAQCRGERSCSATSRRIRQSVLSPATEDPGLAAPLALRKP